MNTELLLVTVLLVDCANMDSNVGGPLFDVFEICDDEQTETPGPDTFSFDRMSDVEDVLFCNVEKSASAEGGSIFFDGGPIFKVLFCDA